LAEIAGSLAASARYAASDLLLLYLYDKRMAKRHGS
jgi:hypothetical protein